jgi:hypothetical protein
MYSSESEMHVKIRSCGEQNVSCYEEDNVSCNSSTQHGEWAKSDTEGAHFPFTGKPGINVDLEDHPLEYFEWLCIPEIVE